MRIAFVSPAFDHEHVLRRTMEELLETAAQQIQMESKK